MALVLDWDAWRAVELDHQPHEGFRYVDRLLDYYAPLWRDNVTCDFVRAAGGLLGGYQPRRRAQPVSGVGAAGRSNLIGYVAGGGTLVVGPFSGITDRDERVLHRRLAGTVAGPARGAGGGALAAARRRAARRRVFAELGDFTATMWAEWTGRGARTCRVRSRRTAPRGPARCSGTGYGAGTAWYVATLPAPDALRRLLRPRLRRGGCRGPVLPDLPPDVEAVRRGDFVFLLHHDTGRVEIRREGAS